MLWEGPEYCYPLFGRSAEIENMPKASDFLTAALVKICMIFLCDDMESRGPSLKPSMSMIEIIQTVCGLIFNARGQ